jgi:hypothetical protein
VIRTYKWSLAYAIAMLEMDPAKMSDRVLEAELAIRECSFDENIEFHELRAMGNALVALQNLREQRLRIEFG